MGQFENITNPRAHEKITAKQIWDQLNGNIQVFCAGLGTTGTVVGCSKFFKEKNPGIRTVGVIRSPNNPIPGVRTRGLLHMIAFNWKVHTDFFEEMGTVESFEKSLSLLRNGLCVGPSSGFAFVGLLKHLKSLSDQDNLKTLKNKNGIINAVFICCDSPLPYIDDYFAFLGEGEFPEIKNEELLLDKPEIKKRNIEENYDYDLSPEETYNAIYNDSKEGLWNKIKNNIDIRINSDFRVIDVRRKKDFSHFRLICSENIEYRDMVLDPKKYAKKLAGKKVIVVCDYGFKSNSVARILKKQGLDAYSLRGGITEWSNLDFPRWKPGICFSS